MALSKVHLGLCLVLSIVAILMIIWLIFSTQYSKSTEDVARVLTVTKEGNLDTGGLIFSREYSQYSADVENYLEKYKIEQHIVFWFFIVGTILVTSRSLVFASCLAPNSMTRKEIIETLQEVNEKEEEKPKTVEEVIESKADNVL